MYRISLHFSYEFSHFRGVFCDVKNSKCYYLIDCSGSALLNATFNRKWRREHECRGVSDGHRVYTDGWNWGGYYSHRSQVTKWSQELWQGCGWWVHERAIG